MSLKFLDELLGPLIAPPRPASQRKKKDKYGQKEYGQFRRLMKKLGATYHVSDDHYVDIAPFDGYPRGIHTYHYDWISTLGRIELALENPKLLDKDGFISE